MKNITDACLLPRAEGPCSEKQSRWFYDQSERRCMPFYYGGCQGNANNFETQDACEQSCRALSLVTGSWSNIPKCSLTLQCFFSFSKTNFIFKTLLLTYLLDFP